MPPPPPPFPPAAPPPAPAGFQPPPPPPDWHPPEGQGSPPVAEGAEGSPWVSPAISAGPARDGQWQRPSPKLWSVRILQLGVGTVASLLIVFGIVSSASNAGGGGIAALVVLVVGIAFAVTAQRRVKAWGYAEREDDLLVRRGVLFRRLSVIPYGRMQFVDVTAGPFERAFGLATVRMHTAAAASDARIPGLPAEEAARLRDQLTALGEAQAAGL